jgi:hypothetical protein
MAAVNPLVQLHYREDMLDILQVSSLCFLASNHTKPAFARAMLRPGQPTSRPRSITPRFLQPPTARLRPPHVLQEHEEHAHDESISDGASTQRLVASSRRHALRTMIRARLAVTSFPQIYTRWGFSARFARLESMGTQPGQ